MPDERTKIQHALVGSKAVILLIVLVGLERLLVFFPPTSADWGKTLHFVISMACLIVVVGLLFRYCAQFVVIARRTLPGYFHLLKSYVGVKSRQAPEAYIRDLFDDYAENFDQHLLDELDYQTPNQIHAILQEVIDTEKAYFILDLGCGTGLCGPFFKSNIGTLVGVDLSADMLAKAQARGLYEHLICDSVTKIEEYYHDYFDLVIAADVLVYFGELDEVLMSVAKVSKPRGYFAFSVEVCESQLWTLKHSGRYAHSRRYITDLAQRLGFKLIRVESRPLRSQKGEPVIGDIYLLKLIR